MSNAQYATLNSTYSLLSSTVTGQINAWLSKLTNVLTVGVAIRTEGEGEGSSQEYEARLIDCLSMVMWVIAIMMSPTSPSSAIWMSKCCLPKMVNGA